MVQHHNWNIEEIENMMPWEREFYVILLNKHIQEENERIQKQNQRMR